MLLNDLHGISEQIGNRLQGHVVLQMCSDKSVAKLVRVPCRHTSGPEHSAQGTAHIPRGRLHIGVFALTVPEVVSAAKQRQTPQSCQQHIRQENLHGLACFCTAKNQMFAFDSIWQYLDGITNCQAAESHHQEKRFQSVIQARLHNLRHFLIRKCHDAGIVHFWWLEVAGWIIGHPSGFMSVAEE